MDLAPCWQGIKPEYSLVNLLGKLVFRQQAPWQQRRKSIILSWSILVGLGFGGLVMATMLLQNGRH
jgi:hypothetical protein